MMASLSDEAVRWGMPPYTRERLERGWWRARGNSDYVIYLHQDYHNVGLGTAMTRSIVELAREEWLHRSGLSVVADNEIAIRVYEKVGFVVEGRLMDAYFGDDGRYHDEVHKGLILG